MFIFAENAYSAICYRVAQYSLLKSSRLGFKINTVARSTLATYRPGWEVYLETRAPEEIITSEEKRNAPVASRNYT